MNEIRSFTGSGLERTWLRLDGRSNVTARRVFGLFDNFERPTPADPSNPDASMTPSAAAGAPGELDVVITDPLDRTGVRAEFSYATGLFDATILTALARRWTRILESIAADLAVAVGTIDALGPPSGQQRRS